MGQVVLKIQPSDLEGLTNHTARLSGKSNGKLALLANRHQQRENKKVSDFESGDFYKAMFKDEIGLQRQVEAGQVRDLAAGKAALASRTRFEGRRGWINAEERFHSKFGNS